MTRYLDFLLPARGRRFGLWFAFGTGLFVLVASVGVSWWGELVSTLVPNTTVEAATSGWWALPLLVLAFAGVYGIVTFVRGRGAPRWIWLPIAALGAWISLASLVGYAVALMPSAAGASDVPSLGMVAASLIDGLSSLIAISLPALLACARSGRTDEPLLGDFGEQRLIFAGTALVVVGVGLPIVAVSQGWLSGVGSTTVILGIPISGARILWTALLPGLACWISTWRFGLPRSVWLTTAIGGLLPVLSVLTPSGWLTNAAQMANALLVGVVFALLTAGASILGAWYGTRGEDAPQPRPAT